MNKKEKIIEYAKDLYLTPKEDGTHKYSLRNIVEEIKQNFNKDLTPATILNWSRKYGWEKLWNEGVRYGVAEAIAKQESDKTKEEQLKEQIAKIKKDKTIMDMNLLKIAYKFIIENGFSNIQEALKAYDTASKNLQANDVIEKMGEEIKIIIPKEIIPDGNQSPE